MEEKVTKYEEFLNETLKKDLSYAMKARDEVNNKITEYLQLSNLINNLKEAAELDEPLKTMFDLGCNFYGQAEIPDPTTLFVNVGLDVHLQLTLDEALAFADKKVKNLQAIASMHTAEITKIKAHVRMVVEGLRELQAINFLPDDPKHRQDLL